MYSFFKEGARYTLQPLGYRLFTIFHFLVISPPAKHMTIKKKVFVAIMEGKLELGLGFGFGLGFRLG